MNNVNNAEALAGSSTAVPDEWYESVVSFDLQLHTRANECEGLTTGKEHRCLLGTCTLPDGRGGTARLGPGSNYIWPCNTGPARPAWMALLLVVVLLRRGRE
ncbi:MAG: hypothetical protein KC912_23545 [Proteobacteria bacterium]|nr:hypothetical protein [Pseudomonadota bacterium]